MFQVSFKEVYNNLNIGHKTIILLRLKGMSYDNIELAVQRKKIIISKFKIKKLINDLLHKDYGYYYEDKYADVFEMFKWEIQSFSDLCVETSITYLYNSYKFKLGSYPIPYYSRSNLSEEKFEFKGVNISFSLNIFLEFVLLEQHLSKNCNGINPKKILELLKKQRIIRGLEEIEHVLNKNKNTVLTDLVTYRYFSSSSIIAKFDRFEKSVKRKNGLFNVDKLFCDNKDFYFSIGILLPVTLFDIINKYKSEFVKDKNVKCLKYPYILVGFNDLKVYFESLVNKYHKYEVQEVAQLINLDCGVEIDYLILNLKKYNKGKIDSDGQIIKNEAEFTEKQAEILKSKLRDDYYIYDDFSNIVKRVKKSLPERIFLTNEIIKLGFRKEYNYFVKNEINDIKLHLQNHILQEDFYRLGIYEEVDSLKRGVIKNLEESYKIIRISDNELITVKKLRKMNLFLKDIYVFIKQIEENVGKDNYFTIDHLVRGHFKYDLVEKYSFNERFYNSIIENCEKFSSIKIDSNIFYCVSRRQITRSTFLSKYLFKLESSVFIYDVKDEIEEDYCFEVSLQTIKCVSEELGYYYDDTFEKIYKNKEYFLLEVFGNERNN